MVASGANNLGGFGSLSHRQAIGMTQVPEALKGTG